MTRKAPLNRLTIKHLRALAALEDKITLTRAAESLSLSQPALSNRLREIERLTDTQIFERSAGRLNFTPLGKVLLNTARIVLDELTRAETYIARAGAVTRRTIRLEVWGYPLHRWLAPFLVEFMQSELDLSIELTANAAQLPLQALVAGAVDVSLGLGGNSRRGLTSRHLFDDELVGLVPLAHALANRRVLMAADFVKPPFVTFSSALEKGQEVECLFEPAGVVPEWVVYAGSADAVCSLVAEGLGLSILSRWTSLQHAAAHRFRCIPLAKPGLRAAWHAVTRSDAGRDPALTLFLDRLGVWAGRHGPGSLNR